MGTLRQRRYRENQLQIESKELSSGYETGPQQFYPLLRFPCLPTPLTAWISQQTSFFLPLVSFMFSQWHVRVDFKGQLGFLMQNNMRMES